MALQRRQRQLAAEKLVPHMLSPVPFPASPRQAQMRQNRKGTLCGAIYTPASMRDMTLASLAHQRQGTATLSPTRKVITQTHRSSPLIGIRRKAASMSSLNNPGALPMSRLYSSIAATNSSRVSCFSFALSAVCPLTLHAYPHENTREHPLRQDVRSDSHLPGLLRRSSGLPFWLRSPGKIINGPDLALPIRFKLGHRETRVQ